MLNVNSLCLSHLQQLPRPNIIVDDIIIEGQTGASTGQEGSTTPPPSKATISITSPSNGATTNGSSLTVIATSAEDVTYAELKLENVYQSHASDSSLTFNLTGLTAGSHELDVYTNSTSAGWINHTINITVNIPSCGGVIYMQDFSSGTVVSIISSGAITTIDATMAKIITNATYAIDVLSWKYDSQNSGSNWNDIFTSPANMQSGKTYKITFDAKKLVNLEEGGYFYAQLKSTSGGASVGCAQWTDWNKSID